MRLCAPAWVNCIRNNAEMRLNHLVGCSLVILLLAHGGAYADAVETDKTYEVTFAATIDPVAKLAHATITVRQPRRLLRSIELHMPAARYVNVRPAARIERNGDTVTWRPLKLGGVLRYDFVIDHLRDNGAPDSRITEKWALFKLDHLFPRARARMVKGATSNATLALVAPKSWAIETPYGRGAGAVLDVVDPQRRFDRPRGWMIAGELGVRRDSVGERIISVASPRGTAIHRNDVLVFLRWTFPSLIEMFPDFPQRLLIVAAPPGMWRGGLSGVGSLYLNHDRAMISGNRTSPVLHELVHVASGLHGGEGADWIVEGLAEYYGMVILLRSGGISERRFGEALASLSKWAANTRCVATDRSQGPQTARAVLVMRALDAQIRAATDNQESLDALTLQLVRAGVPVTNAEFHARAEQLMGGPVAALADCPR